MSEMIPRWRGSFAPLAPSQAPIWECPSEQATPDHLYYPAALECERATSQAYRNLHAKERRVRRVYQVLALLGWAAVVVMGVFYG